MDFGNILNEILRTTATSFDFAFVICVNVLAYLVIKLVDKLNGDKVVSTWNKRVITLVCAVLMGVIYFSLKLGDVKVVLNSIILSFVFWSWILKPILAFFKIDYKKFIIEDDEPNQYPKYVLLVRVVSEGRLAMVGSYSIYISLWGNKTTSHAPTLS